MGVNNIESKYILTFEFRRIMARQKKVSNVKNKYKETKKSKKKTTSAKSRTTKVIETEDECGSTSTFRQLLKFKKVEELLFLASRIFQKEPQIYDSVEKSQESSLSKSEVAGAVRQCLFTYISDIIQNVNAFNSSRLDSSAISLPRKWENYIAFCDLVFVARNISRMNWSTYVLQDYKKTLHIQPDTAEADVLASVQVDTTPIPENYRYDNPSSASEEMVLIRIVTTRKTRNPAKDRNNLLSRRSTFFVYFPGEAYFYSTTAKPNIKYCQALVECLHCTSYCALPLSDRDIFSLRRLRMNRDTLSKNSNIMSSIIDDDLIGYYNEAVLSRYAIDGEQHHQNTSSETDEDSSRLQERLPSLRNYKINCISEYDGNESAFRFKDARKDLSNPTEAIDKLDISVQFSGGDVLNAFSAMAQYSVSNSSKSKYFETPLPKWLKESACRGRNTITLLHKKAQVENVDEDDAMSVAASEMTNWGGTKATLRLPASSQN